MSNRFRNKEAEEEVLHEPEPTPEPQPEANTVSMQGEQASKATRRIAGVLGGDVLKSPFVRKQIPLLLLIMVYLIIIVGNRYKVESLSREKMELEDRIGYLREHRIQLQKQYQESVKISHVAEALESRGIGFTACPPYEVNQ
ncbi:MAG: hypothetical protein K6F85_02430 [Bacteroidales bacterium]|nr:hypothetical protein [Bacteroidales bacterium]